MSVPKRRSSVVSGFSELPTISREPRYDVVIDNISHDDTNNLTTLVIRKPDGFTFKSGQYLWLVLPKLSAKKDYVDRHAYTIASAADSDVLELIIRITNSEFTTAVRALKNDQNVQIIGPFGSVFTSDSTPAVCFAGGTGLTPFLSRIRSGQFLDSLLVTYNQQGMPPHLKAELDHLASSRGFEVEYLSGKPNKHDVKKCIAKYNVQKFMVSGPQGFVNSMSSILEELGIDSKQIHYEALYPTAKTDLKIEKILKPIIADGKRYITRTNRLSSSQNLKDLLAQIIEQASNHIIVTDKNGYILFANPAAQRLTGYSLKEMYHQTPRLWGGLMSVEYYDELWKRKSSGHFVTHKLLNRRKDGKLYVALGRITPIRIDGTVAAYVATEEDITLMHQIDKAKTEFVSLASHQLRTPLSAINWYTEMLLAGDAGQPSDMQVQYLNEVYASSQRMVGLINALLNVSRLELGTFTVEPEDIDPKAEAEQVISELKPNFAEREQVFDFTSTSPIPGVMFDKKYLQVIYQNLLSNASKYTPEKGKITLHIEPVVGGQIVAGHTIPDKGFLSVVSDTGYGIPVSSKDKIFTKMFRAENIVEKDTEGTGLGLYIVKEIVDYCEGMIWFESREDRGTTFYVYLPLSVSPKVGSKKLT